MKASLTQKGTVSLFFIVITVAVLAVLMFVGYSQYRIKHNTRKLTQQPTDNILNTNDKNITGTLKGQVFCTEKVDEQPCQSGFTLTHAKSTNPGESVSGLAQTVQSDSQGKYSLDIAPGSYNIVPLPKNGYPVIVPINNPVVVLADKATAVTIRYMDGTK